MPRRSSSRLTLVMDSSTIIVLHEIQMLGMLDALRSTGVNIVIPAEVRLELERGRSGIIVGEKPCPDAPSPEDRGDELAGLLEGLGKGEKSAIMTAYRLVSTGIQAIVVTDDARARSRCQRLGIPVIGTLGLIELAKLRGAIPPHQALALLDAVKASSLYISAEVFAYARGRIESQLREA